MDIPQELFAHEIIRYLPVEDILELCQTNKTLQSICQDDATWKYLIGRDFGYSFEGENARDEYFYAKWVHDASDVPANLIKTEYMEELLLLWDYTKVNGIYYLDKIDAEAYYESIIDGIQALLEDRVEMTGVWNLNGIYLDITSRETLFKKNHPALFHLIKGKYRDYFLIFYSDIAKIYDFYHGRGAFWKGFENYVKEYLNSLSSELKIRAEQVVADYKKSIFNL